MKELDAAVLGIVPLVVLFGGITLLWWSVVQWTDHDPFYQPYHYEQQVVPPDPPKIYSA